MKNDSPNKIALPGSPQATACGCLCPSTDNLKGKSIFISPAADKTGNALFWMQANCPLHGVNKSAIEIIADPSPEQLEGFWTDK